MLFRDFIGEDNSRIKRMVERKYRLIEKECSFSLSKKDLKRSFDYIKSWLIRYKIQFEALSPYLTLYVINNANNYRIINENIDQDEEVIYKPEEGFELINNNLNNKNYIVLTYKKNKDHVKEMKNIFNKFNIGIVEECFFVKLFEVKDSLDKLYYDMIYSAPENSDIKLGNFCLINR